MHLRHCVRKKLRFTVDAFTGSRLSVVPASGIALRVPFSTTQTLNVLRLVAPGSTLDVGQVVQSGRQLRSAPRFYYRTTSTPDLPKSAFPETPILFEDFLGIIRVSRWIWAMIFRMFMNIRIMKYCKTLFASVTLS